MAAGGGQKQLPIWALFLVVVAAFILTRFPLAETMAQRYTAEHGWDWAFRPAADGRHVLAPGRPDPVLLDAQRIYDMGWAYYYGDDGALYREEPPAGAGLAAIWRGVDAVDELVRTYGMRSSPTADEVANLIGYMHLMKKMSITRDNFVVLTPSAMRRLVARVRKLATAPLGLAERLEQLSSDYMTLVHDHIPTGAGTLK